MSEMDKTAAQMRQAIRDSRKINKKRRTEVKCSLCGLMPEEQKDLGCGKYLCRWQYGDANA